MFYKYIKFLLQVVIIFSLYYMLSDYISENALIIIIILIALIFVMFGYFGRKRYLFDLEVACNAPKYLANISSKLKNKDESYYLLYKAYGTIFISEVNKVENDLSKIDRDKLNEKEKFMLDEIYLKVAYYNNDRTTYNNLLEKMSKTYLDKIYTNDLNAFEIPLYLMDEKYEEAVGILFKEITSNKKRLRIIELEYYLILSYLALDNKDDAVAVLEFIVKRNYDLIYTTKSRELLEKIQND